MTTNDTSTDYQATFRTGSAYGRQSALGDVLVDMAFLVGVLDAGGTITAEQYRELYAGIETAYATANERYRVAANIPA